MSLRGRSCREAEPPETCSEGAATEGGASVLAGEVAGQDSSRGEVEVGRVCLEVRMSLPRTIHHVWMGDDPIPPFVAACRQSVIDLHPGWEFRLWTDASIFDHPDIAPFRD